MARLPDKNALSGPVSLRSNRAIATYDTTAIGRGISAAGDAIAGIGAQIKERDNALDIARAEAYKTKGLLDVQNEFDVDPDYSTFDKRAPTKTGDVVKNAANLIRDPNMRQRWALGAQNDAARYNDSIFDRGTTLKRQAEVTALDDALEINRRLYVDPESPDEVKKKARADIEGTLATAEATGLLTPEMGNVRRKLFIEDADYSRAELAVQRDPSVIPDRNAGPVAAVVNRIIGNESGGDPTAQNNRSSAGGLGGFIDSTWVATVRKYRPDIARGMNNDQIIELKKTDPTLAVEMTTKFVQENANFLAKSGNAVTPANLYLAHFAGQGGASAVLRADDATPLTTVLSPAAIRANPEVLGSGKTVGDLKRWAEEKMGGLASGSPLASGPVPQVQFIDETAGKIRSKPVQGWVKDGIARAAGATDPRIAIKIVSGGQNPLGVGGPRTGSTRHDDGNSADIVLVVDGKPVLPGENKALYAAFLRNAAAAGMTGLGHYSWGIHVGGGKKAAWGPDTTGKTLDPVFAKAIEEGWASAGSGAAAGPDWWGRLSPEQQQDIQNKAQARSNQIAVETRGQIEVAAANAPAAILNTGQYDGILPTADQFMQAYGPEDGARRFNAFSADVETSQQAFEFRTMSADQIKAAISEAVPTSSGDNAALETARYETLTKAAETILKVREADPATYARQAFPSVDAAWSNVQQEGGYRAAIAASVAAQQQLGVADVKPLPKFAADEAVTTFKDEQAPVNDRVAAVMRVLVATDDGPQRRALFEQLADAGLPDTTEGAIDAYLRGDTGAANRLFEAAMVDPSKLPGKIDATPAEIDEEIQGALFAEGEIGDIFYGISDGSADNLISAQRDNKLLSNAVNIRMRRGETLDDAVQGAAKDLFGDVQVVNESNAQIILPKDADAAAVLSGLESILPDVRRAVADALTLQGPVPTSDGTKAIMDATTANRIEDILATGYFRNAEGGYVYIDPYTGGAIPDANGNPVIFTLPEMSAPVDGNGNPVPVAPEAPSFSKTMRMENEARQKVFQ